MSIEQYPKCQYCGERHPVSLTCSAKANFLEDTQVLEWSKKKLFDD